MGDRSTGDREGDLISSDFNLRESENTWETEPSQCGVREYLGVGTTLMWSPRIPGRWNHVNVESENTWETESRQCGVRAELVIEGSPRGRPKKWETGIRESQKET